MKVESHVLCTSFCENTFDGIKVLKRKRCETDRLADTQTAMSITICPPTPGRGVIIFENVSSVICGQRKP